MARARLLLGLPALAMLLSGCAAALAASAVGAGAEAVGPGRGQNRGFMEAAARQACSAHAAQYGAVQITGARQASLGEIVVSGTVTGQAGRQAFECSFVTEVTGFELRPIQPGS